MHMQSLGAVPEMGPTMWTATTQSWPLSWQHEHFLTACWTSPTSRRSLPKNVCVLCWYASNAGMSDDVRRIGFRLDAPLGHCKRNLDSVLDFAVRQFYKLESMTLHAAASTCAWCQDTRCSMWKLTVMLGCRHAKTTNGLPKKYHEHPVVKRNPNKDVFPVA